MPRKTDSKNPADWLWIAQSEMEMIAPALAQEISFIACRARMAEIVEKIAKAELIRLGWLLEKTHDLNRLWGCAGGIWFTGRDRGDSALPRFRGCVFH
ncbi:MAG: hypothetical protein EXS31_08365 [Pedosphaera sp.]|nr:hypothetical protein [Pedosphaera sp.]